MKPILRIGSGAGFSGDRLEPAVALAEHGALDYLVLECLAERTIALAQLRRVADPAAGFDPLLVRRLRPLLPFIKARGLRLVTNMGAANPLAAARRVVELARELGTPVRVAAVTGDEVLELLDPAQPTLETGQPLAHYPQLVSANAYLGVEALLPALASDAQVIISGRVADPSLFLAPVVHHFGWSLDDHERLGQGTVMGHLLECAGQLTGGYYADPGVKDVPGLAWLGFPWADVDAEGGMELGKIPASGGIISLATVKEQLLYEVTDPAAYVTPDVVADFCGVRLRATGPDRVRVEGGRGSPRSSTLKVSVGYRAGFVGEGEMSYGGHNCVARGRLAGEIVRERLAGEFAQLQVDLLGVSSLHGEERGAQSRPYEVRLRVAGRAEDAARAARVGEEVEALYTNGPAGGGGARKSVVEQVGIVSCLLPRDRVRTGVEMFGP